jgi:hypothetical protein
MASFQKSTDPREPQTVRQQTDYIPLRKVRRDSHNKNVWNKDNGDEDISKTLRSHHSRVSWEENAVGRQSLESNGSLDFDELDPDAESAERLIQGTVCLTDLPSFKCLSLHPLTMRMNCDHRQRTRG